MIDVTAFIMGTCRPQRLEWLEQTIDYLDNQNFPFVKKILAIDEFDGYAFPQNLKKKFNSRDWVVLIDNHKSRWKSMVHAFQHIKTTHTFYNEEDVMATLPNIRLLSEIFDTIVNGRMCGMVSMTLGGSTNHFPAGEYGDLKDVWVNFIHQEENQIVFRRLEEKRNDYFFEFPGLFANTVVFRTCLSCAIKNFHGKSIEEGLTAAYFHLGFDESFYKASIAKSNLPHIIETNPDAFIKECRLLENLDPEQGCSSSGGNHYF